MSTLKHIIKIFISTTGIFHYSQRRFFDSNAIEKELSESDSRMSEKWDEFHRYNDWYIFLNDTSKGLSEYRKRIVNG